MSSSPTKIKLEDLPIYDPPTLATVTAGETIETLGSRLTAAPAKAIEEKVRTVRQMTFPYLAKSIDQAESLMQKTESVARKAEHSVSEMGTDPALLAKVSAIPLSGLLCAMLFLRRGSLARFSAFTVGSGAAGAAVYPNEATYMYDKVSEYVIQLWHATKPSGSDK